MVEFAPLMRAKLCLIFCAGLGEQMLDAVHIAQSVLSVETSVLGSCTGGCCSDWTGAEHVYPALRWHGAPAEENARVLLGGKDCLGEKTRRDMHR